MATSGTRGQTIIDVTSVIEHAARRCGVLSSVLTSENQQSARDNLFLILSNFANKGLSLFCIEKIVFVLNAGQRKYDFPISVVDMLQMNLRQQAVQYPNTGSAAGEVNLTLTTALQIESVAVVAGASGDYIFEFATSPDNVQWTVVAVSSSTAVSAGDRVCLDADPTPTNLYWRVRDISIVPKALTSAVFYGTSNSIPMAKLNRDDYTQLPNRTFSTNNPLQYWFDKQWATPRVWVWPVPQSDGQQVESWVQLMIEDPGAFTNQLAIPPRWLEAAISALAPLVCLELPKELVPPDRYDKLVLRADVSLKEAEDGERDGAPIRFQANISPYTR